MIDLTVNKETLQKAISHARKRGIVLPTYAQMRDPSLIPQSIKDKLSKVGLWDVDPLNLFRVSWHNQPVEQGGGFGDVNLVEFLPALTGVPARIIALAGKWFPTGCHKVGASYSCLVTRLVTGQFDPTYHKAAWPSTGNYCRGGAYNSALLGCPSIAILPAGMSRERFEWLQGMAGEVIATPGTESNVKEIFDKVHELRVTRPDVMVFDQFQELANSLWHYHVTGPALAEAYEGIRRDKDRLAGLCLTSGSAGSLSAGDYIKDNYPAAKLAVCEALQCPTLLINGFGEHRIEGIGDKHVPWIHNTKNSDLVIDIDDEYSQNLLRLFNEKEGRQYLSQHMGLDDEYIEKLSWLGISGIANMLSAIKFAKYYELTEHDIVLTVLTDSAAMYGSRLAELAEEKGAYNKTRAACDHEHYILGSSVEHMEELTYITRKRIHNLKYYTWVEQQGKSVDELNAQWYDYDNYWHTMHMQVDEVDALIEEFNSYSA
ncbi:MAG: pyridoxal-5-phosphate-dependent protein subunit beta [Firmicutes bacterium]|nr:pyridoxal-5-phosphate-dependent protein subunit beta [Bacillota bacterium]